MQEFLNTHNPVLPVSVHVPDCEGHVMPDGKLYLYGSYDDREDVYCSGQYHVVSTPDMEHWTIHDISLNGRDRLHIRCCCPAAASIRRYL